MISTASKALALHSSVLDLIPGTPYHILSTASSNSQVQSQKSALNTIRYGPDKQKLRVRGSLGLGVCGKTGRSLRSNQRWFLALKDCYSGGWSASTARRHLPRTQLTHVQFLVPNMYDTYPSSLEVISERKTKSKPSVLLGMAHKHPPKRIGTQLFRTICPFPAWWSDLSIHFIYINAKEKD